MILINVIAPFVAYFPVCLAYSGGGYLPNGCKFVETVVLTTTIIFVFGIIGYVGSEKIYLICKKEMLITGILFWIVMANINPSWKLTQSVSWEMWKGIAYGSYKEYYDGVNDIYDLSAGDDNEDVFIYEKPEAVNGFSEINLSEDMSNWVNTAIAQYYHKKSVQYVSTPLVVQNDGQKYIRISSDIFEGKQGYVSIFKIDEATQDVDVIQVLHPLESNMIIHVEKDAIGKVGVYLFEDSEGQSQIDMVEINY